MARKDDIVRLGVDIGGTFTDVALEVGRDRYTLKVLTDAAAPEKGVLRAIGEIAGRAGIAASDVDLVIHGTTLATNALIERRGARTALITTVGFRDTLEMRAEDRYEQYDVSIDFPKPLVPRRHRFAVSERMDSRGNVLIPLDEAGLEALLPEIERAGIEALAIGFLHSYVNQAHERRADEIVKARFPDLAVSLSSEVSPEMREYERISTTCANAYVQPLVAAYLGSLERDLRRLGFEGPLLVMLSGGGLATVDTCIRCPVRMVESGPAGGAIYASHVAHACGLDKVISFDMGGTTAKICMIDGFRPQTARTFEVARMYRFKKGSGLPLRIPVIEMVEIGAGGGSVARIDALNNIAVGPDSAGADPGPACYGRGGDSPTVTDADVVLGRVDPQTFSGGAIELDAEAARTALMADIGQRLQVSPEMAAFGVSEIVDENMVNAARVHAIESGKDVGDRVLVAFGGAAPLHAARMAEKLGVQRYLVPTAAGVGSAVGFLRAPVAYEIVRSSYQRLTTFDIEGANGLLRDMSASARAVVEPAAFGAPIEETRYAFMRYAGQGHELAVDIPVRDLKPGDEDLLKTTFEKRYRQLFSWTVPVADLELLSWTVVVTASADADVRDGAEEDPYRPKPVGHRDVFDMAAERFTPVPVHWRPDLRPGAVITGPAVIAEDETSTVVSAAFEARITGLGYIECTRRTGGQGAAP